MITPSDLLHRLAKNGKVKAKHESQLLQRLAYVLDTPLNKYDCPHCHMKRLLERASKMHNIAIGNFVRRQTKESQHSHWEIDDDLLLMRIEDGWGKQKRGYRDGVILVPIDPEGLFSAIAVMQEGDKLEGEFTARKPGEEPRKHTYLIGEKQPAKAAYAVLYHHDVLAEKNENETDAEWEVVSINAMPTEEWSEIPVGTLIANHLELSGGTATKMTDAEFVAALRKSVLYWKDKAHVKPK